MYLHHHTHSSRSTLTALLSGAFLAGCLWAAPHAARAQPGQAASMLTMAEQAQANGQHQAALEILVSLMGQVPAAQLSGMLAQSELAMQDYRMAELTAIAALREPTDPWVSQHRDLLLETLAQAGRHLGEVVVEGLPSGLPVSTRDLNLGVTGQRLRLAEGPRVLTIALPDGQRLQLTAQVVAGQTTSVDGSTASRVGGTGPGAAQPTTAPPTPFAPSAQPTPFAPTPFAPAAPPSGIAPAPFSQPSYVPAQPVAAAPTAPLGAQAAYAPAGQIHAAPTAGGQPLFREQGAPPPAPVERAASRFGLGLDIGGDRGLEYFSMQSQSIDADAYAREGLDASAIVGGIHLFFQHDLGAHFSLHTQLGYASHGRHAMSAWGLYGDPDFDLRVRVMDGHVNRLDLGETARIIFGRRDAWFTSYIGFGGRVGVSIFRYHGTNVWRTIGGGNCNYSGDCYTTPSSGAEVGYMAQGVIELGNYFGRQRTVEFGARIGVGKPTLSISAQLGVSFNGW